VTPIAFALNANGLQTLLKLISQSTTYETYETYDFHYIPLFFRRKRGTFMGFMGFLSPVIVVMVMGTSWAVISLNQSKYK
jgi:hypothetical protein